MEQRTLCLNDGNVVYCYEDGSVEWYDKCHKKLHKTFGWNDGGYKRVTISGKHYFVHRLIATAFHSNTHNLPQVDHRNRIKSDNRPCNLRWASAKTNSDNRDYVDRSIAKYGVRKCDNVKAYYRIKNHRSLCVIKPDGTNTRTGYLSPEIYALLKPLSMKDRYLKYSKLKQL